MDKTRYNASREDAEVAALRLNLIEKIGRLTETEPSKLTKVPGLVLYKRTRPVAFTSPRCNTSGHSVQLNGHVNPGDLFKRGLTSVSLPEASVVQETGGAKTHDESNENLPGVIWEEVTAILKNHRTLDAGPASPPC